jgi:hypothetical protein
MANKNRYAFEILENIEVFHRPEGRPPQPFGLTHDPQPQFILGLTHDPQPQFILGLTHDPQPFGLTRDPQPFGLRVMGPPQYNIILWWTNPSGWPVRVMGQPFGLRVMGRVPVFYF